MPAVLDKLRSRLAHSDGLPYLALLAILVGVIAGVVIVAFRFLIHGLQDLYLHSDGFSSLSMWQRLLIPTAGGLLLGLIFQALSPQQRGVGVVHVIERLHHHRGYLPLGNTLLQFFSAAISLASGHSVGREGPGIHLGAANGSLLGQWLRLPDNSLTILISCGIAAAIGASFNTPLAGVIFAMEVVMMEYTVVGFAPVILASVSATLVTRAVYGTAPAFSVPALQLGTPMELPFILLLALAIGALAASFITLLQGFSHAGSRLPVWLRLTLGGLITGLCALFIPQVMGVGYDTVNLALLGELGGWLLFGLLITKLVATAGAIGLGLPGGLIAPTLVMGAGLGGLLGLAASHYFPEVVSSHGFYALLGMGAMMGATLQAPLAALVAMLELTANPNILLPGMLVVIVSGMVSRYLFGKEAVFVTLLKGRGLHLRNDPLSQSLRKLSVARAMSRDFAYMGTRLDESSAQSIKDKPPRWILLDSDKSLITTSELSPYLDKMETDSLDLTQLALTRQPTQAISQHATLQYALDLMEQKSLDVLHVLYRQQVVGILRREDIEAYYRYNG